MFNQTEEDFLLSCVQEVFKVWSSHGKADLNISVNNGQAAVHLDLQLREPNQLHTCGHHKQEKAYPLPWKYKSPVKKEKDRVRAAEHQRKLKQSQFPFSAASPSTIPTSAASAATPTFSSSSSTTVPVVTSLTSPLQSSAAPAVVSSTTPVLSSS